MTIVESNKELNELINNKIFIKHYPKSDYVSTWTLEGRHILCDGEPIGPHANTIDKRMDLLCQDARRAYFIEEILKSVGIIIDDIENNYDVAHSDEANIVFYKKSDNIYTFIEFYNKMFYDSGFNLEVVKLDLNTNNLIYDRIDLEELKHYHGKGKISKFTLGKIENWGKNPINQNNLYDVIAEGVAEPKYRCAWSGMDEFGSFVDDLNIDKLDKNICKVERVPKKEKVIVYYL